MRLNLGCGSNKIKDAINIDVEKSCKPDLVCDFLTQQLPYEQESANEVYLFHTIEHIKKSLHGFLLNEIWRVLKPTGLFLVSFPEFRKCFKNWESNKSGQKTFWEATLFGRQLYPSDHHVCAMDSVDFSNLLRETGFHSFKIMPEPIPNEFNTIISCRKGEKLPSYEEVMLRETNLIEIKK